MRRSIVNFACILPVVAVLTVSFANHVDAQQFIRGDANVDGAADISDGVFTLNWLFQGGDEPLCLKSLDANDTGAVDLSDAIFEFNFLFLGGPAMPAPYPECGVDPTDDELSCKSFDFCGPVLDPVEQLTLARAAEDGVVDIEIPGVVVTYLRPEVDSTPAGFFVQASATGPAILVEADPAAQDPVLAVGDVIDLRATEVGSGNGARIVIAFTDLSVASSGFDVGTYVQDVQNDPDLVTNLDDYESEMITTPCQLVGAFGFAGGGHTSIQIDTPSVTDDSGLKLRMPQTLRDTLAAKNNFVEGCNLVITGPMGRFFGQAQPSVYVAEDLEVVDCPEPPVDPSDAIALARVTGDGVADIFVRGATITYIRPVVGSSPAGFFIQAAQEGPAVLVEIDPDNPPDPPLVVGDVITFTITEMDTVFDARTVSGYADLEVVGIGFDVAGLVQDVSLAEDLVSNLDDYESELLHLTCNLVGAFGGAGGGHVSSEIETDGITGNPDLLLRIPSALRDALAATNNLVEGCELEVTGPMWRFRGDAQPSAYTEDDITVNSCPAPPHPQVTGANASTATDVVVSFDIAIDPSSITDARTQFTFTPALTVTGHSVDGTDVTITSMPHSPSTDYTVEVAPTVTSLLGAEVDAANNLATFTSLASGLSFASVNYTVVAHGASLTVTGNGLTDIDEVTIGDEPQSFTEVSPTQLTITDVPDSTPTGAQNLVITTSGGDSTDPFELTVIHLVINELDADQTSTDAAEFVEFSAGIAGVDLSGYILLLLNGSDDRSYTAHDLAGTTNADGLLWIGPAGFVPAPQATFPRATNQVQNGADGAVLLQGSVGDFPNDSPIPASGLIDALIYGTGDGDDAGLLDGVFGAGNAAAAQIDEGANGMKDTQSIQRCDSARMDGSVWIVIEPTAGAVNNCP
jgi:hypothetical protein